MQSPSGRAGLAILLVFLLFLILGESITPYDPYEQNLRNRLVAPNSQHWFGTDSLGRDLLSRIIVGTRYSLGIGIAAMVVAFLVGVPIGLVAGYFGGAIEAVIMRLVDLLLTFPRLLLAILVATVAGPGLATVVFAIVFLSIPVLIRLVRGAMLALMQEDFVSAARALGARANRIMFWHALPNIISPVIVQVTFIMAEAILIAGALSFIGVGIQPPDPEWGAMLSEGRRYIRTAPHVLVFPGLALALCVFGINLLGDALRQAYDPRSQPG